MQYDFINIEKLSGSETLVLIHDCLPLDERTSSRQRLSQFWSGDVWKIVPCLKSERPDLKLVTVPAYPTGLCFIRGLNPESDYLEKNYNSVVERYIDLDYNLIKDETEYFSLIENEWQTIKELIF